MDPAEFCRQVEAYLCRRNEGHLVRIVGPAFERVCQWAERGVPLKIVFHGVDRYCDRYYSAGPRRRPVRIEFCEADVLDVFDEWRRAVGIAMLKEPAPADGQDRSSAERTPRRRSSLLAHVDRAIVRLSSAVASSTTPERLHPALQDILSELDAIREPARRARGDQRAKALERLSSLQQRLVAVARERADPGLIAQLRREAEADLEPFQGRMAPADLDHAVDRAVSRLLTERLALPRLAFE